MPAVSTLTLRDLGRLDPASALGRAWEALVRNHPASGVMQSLAWAAFKRRLGLRTLHFGLFDGGALAGGAIAYAARVPAGGCGADVGLLVVPEGPVLPWDDAERAVAGLRLIVEAVERHPLAGRAPAVGAVGLRVEPRLAPPRPRALRGFRRAPVDLLPVETLGLDLTLPPEALLAAMRPKGRYNLRLAARRGVAVRADTSPAAVAAFYRLLVEAGERDAFFVEPPAFFAALLAELGPPGIARILLAEHAGETLGALLLVTYGRRATYLYGGIANHGRHLMAGYALQWGAIEAARAAGCVEYDFYGYEPTGAPEHQYAGFSRFKRQFGGAERTFVGAHDYVFLDRLADAVIRAAREVEPDGARPRAHPGSPRNRATPRLTATQRGAT